MTDDNTIPARVAQIHWTEGDDRSRRGVERVLVFNRSLPWEDDLDLECSLGACCSDWMDPAEPRSSPEGVYARWLLKGFRSPEAHAQALIELAKIEGCVWARVLADALSRETDDLACAA